MTKQTIKVTDRTDRVETGSVEFVYSDGNVDWPGLFLRGDNYMGLRMYLNGLKFFIEELAKDKDSLPAQNAQFYIKLIEGYLIDDDVIQGNLLKDEIPESKNVEDYLRKYSISDGFAGKDDEKALQELRNLAGAMDGTWVPISVAMIAIQQVLSKKLQYQGMSWYKPDQPDSKEILEAKET
jgi:hypothetical protein